MTGILQKGIRRLVAEMRERRRWGALRSAEDICVYYGMDYLPSREDLISGGIVKFLDLAEQFPNAIEKANILYMVSSALPDRRGLLARAVHRARGRFVLNQNGVAYPAWAGKGWKAINAPNARVYAMADHVVYQSEFCRRCAEQFLGPRNGPGEVLYNPVNTENFLPREGFDQSTRAPVLLAAGSHHDAYRVKRVIEALAAIRSEESDACLIVAGRLVWGPDAEAEARGWVRELGLAEVVEFSGPYSQTEAPLIIQQADLLVHLKVQDPCPRLAVEAMACGVPVIYSLTGGVPELVGDEGGVGIPGEESFDQMHIPSSDEVAAGILSALENRDTLARQARARAIRLFSSQDWVEAHARIFTSLAKGVAL